MCIRDRAGRRLAPLVGNQLHHQHAVDELVCCGHPNTRRRKAVDRLDLGRLPREFLFLTAVPGALVDGALSTAVLHLPTFGVLGALFAAFAYVAVRKLGATEPPILVVFYFPAISVPVSLPFALSEWVWPDLQGWLLLLGVGAATQTAQLALTKGLARERAGKATSVGYLQIAFALVFGAAFFGQVPGPWSWAGMALVVGSVVFAQRR